MYDSYKDFASVASGIRHSGISSVDTHKSLIYRTQVQRVFGREVIIWLVGAFSDS